MKEISIEKSRVKDFLAQRLTFNVLQAEENDLFELIRNEGLGGYEKMSDKDLFNDLVAAIPEFQLLRLSKADAINLYLGVKAEYAKTEEDILVDIHRIIQMKL